MFDAVTVGLHGSEVFIPDRTWVDGDPCFTFKTIERGGILEIELKLLSVK